MMIDPENIPTDTELAVKLPALIHALDYHEFHHLEYIYEMIGLDVKIEEVGYFDGYYYGLVHTDTTAHQQLAEGLRGHFENLNDQ